MKKSYKIVLLLLFISIVVDSIPDAIPVANVFLYQNKALTLEKVEKDTYKANMGIYEVYLEIGKDSLNDFRIVLHQFPSLEEDKTYTEERMSNDHFFSKKNDTQYELKDAYFYKKKISIFPSINRKINFTLVLDRENKREPSLIYTLMPSRK